MPFHPRAVVIVGAPLAAWAFFGCLGLTEVSSGNAGALAIFWGVFWIVIGWFGTGRSGVSASMRVGAIITSMFLPVPAYLLTVCAEWFALIPANVGMPMFGILCSSAPMVFWTLTLKSRRKRRSNGPMLVMNWNHYESSAPETSIPPRTSTFRRVV